MHQIGFLQGRLSPKPQDRIQAFPKDSWREEFPRAKELGFNCVELIYDDLYLEDNPLNSLEGRKDLLGLSEENGVTIDSICADYFMSHFLFDETPEKLIRNTERAIELLHIAKEVKCSLVEFPFVDSSSINSSKKKDRVIEVFKKLSNAAEKLEIRLALETDLPPVAFRSLLESLPRNVGANLDLGNSAALGYDPISECRAYGTRVFNVHIKDRILGGTTVPLETGHTDFTRAFTGLKMAEYGGNFILQTCPSPEYLSAAKKYREMVQNWITQTWTLD